MASVAVNEKLEKAKALFEQARTIINDEAATAEAKAGVQALIDEARKLKEDVLALTEIEDAALSLEAIPQSPEIPEGAGGQFKSWGDYLKSVWKQGAGKGNDPRLYYFDDNAQPGKPATQEQKDLAESVGASGGYLVPTEFQAQLLSVMGQSALVRSRATIIRMARRSVQIPVLDQSGATAGQPHWFGGMQAYWLEEAAEKTQSDPVFRMIELVAHKLIMYTRASDELVDDSAISLADFFAGPMGFAGAIAWMEDYAFLRGSGAGQPLGVINAGATISVTREQEQSVTYNDLTNMMENFLPSGQGVWFASQTLMSNLLQMSGPTGNASYLWGSLKDGVPTSLLGMPIVFTEKLPTAASGDAGVIMLADWKYYLVGDRQATTVESTKFDRWRYDQTSWRAVHRVDGQPWLSAPLTLQDGVAQVSPFVILGAKST